VTPEAAVFWVLALVTVGSAVVVVLARFTFMGVAGLYLLLGADFLATTQLLVYVGGILVLLLFGVMLTHKLYDLDLRTEVTQFGAGLVIAAGVFVLLGWPWGWPFGRPGLLWQTSWAMGPGRPPTYTTAEIGGLFMGKFLLPFEAASILLLVALMGAAMIVRRRKDA
jgi:NADH-quinone oxidoreductase subunit J